MGDLTHSRLALNGKHATPPRGAARPASPETLPRPGVARRWVLAAALTTLIALAYPRLWGAAEGLWSVPAGLTLLLVAWVGLRAAPAAAAVLCLAGLISGVPWIDALLEGILLGGLAPAAWWCYRERMGGTRLLNDPRSATLFLILLPGAATCVTALLMALLRLGTGAAADVSALTGMLWLAQALGILALAAPLLTCATPWLVRRGFAAPEPDRKAMPLPALPWTAGEAVELAGLALAAAALGIVQGVLHARHQPPTWPLWCGQLLLVVWTSLRQGPRGTVAAAAGAVCGLETAAWLGAGPAAALQGNFLAQCAAALMVGASSGWIRASEARYRQFVGHMPVALYSARLLGRGGEVPAAEVTLVSPASSQVLGHEPAELLGDHRRWLELVHPDDRELLGAALRQLELQRVPVVCEYRLREVAAPSRAGARATDLLPGVPLRVGPPERWVRDTLAPHYGLDGRLEGWEGVVEDITEQRRLSHELRRTGGMLQALVTHMPTGVFFVQGPAGQPVFVNARARQLLGQREDLSAGLDRLAEVYRLHRADGSPFPWEDLPVSRALRSGVSSMRDDIVVHRPDGRKIPLVTWAAPVDLGGDGRVDGAVWVLEDLTALHQAEAARHESEARLRAIIETMAEGLVVQDGSGTFLEWNPAARAILGATDKELAARTALGPKGCTVREDGTLLSRHEQPDRVSLATGQPVRGFVLGVPGPDGGQRWLLANSLPLPSVTTSPRQPPEPRVLTTFTDVTAAHRAAEVQRVSEENYRGLVETLPLPVLRLDREQRAVYLNPAVQAVTGLSPEGLAGGGAWRRLIYPDDLAAAEALVTGAMAGRPGRAEVRFLTGPAPGSAGLLLTQPSPGSGGAGATLLLVDLASQRRLESELRRVQRLEVVGQLAGGIVHDINNLLTVVLGLAELGEEHASQGLPVGADLRQIASAAEQASQLAGQLLAFGKGKRLEARAVDVNAVAEHTLSLLRGTLPASVAIETDLAAGGAPVLADGSELRRALMNLCLNARDAMPEGGRLSVRTRREGAWSVVTVADTGHGMDESVRARLFDLCFTTRARGTGLGLAVVRQTVEGFGGRIEVESTPGAGARFDVWLPAPPENSVVSGQWSVVSEREKPTGSNPWA